MSAAPSTEARVDPVPVPKLLEPGVVVDRRYRIEAYLGGGGMASVYRATHVLLEQPVAIKVVSPQIRLLPGMAQRFLREARAATRMKGEHVARVTDVGTMADGAPFMVMEYLDGCDLDVVLESGEEIAVEDAVDYVLQACEALAEVHGSGIVHRDLKPANLFLTRATDGSPCIKLIDFGISRSDSPLTPRDLAELTQPDALLGSPRYMSPEQMQSTKNADHRSDIYGIGAVLYELLTRRTPHDGETLLDIYASATLGPPAVPSSLRSDVPAALDDVIMRCLRIDPSERFADAAELAFALAPFGPKGSERRAKVITRVLDASRQRAKSGAGEARGSYPGDASHVRRRVPSSAHARRQRRLRRGVTILASLALVLLGVGAREIYARGLARGAAQTASIAPATPSVSEPAVTSAELTKALDEGPPGEGVTSGTIQLASEAIDAAVSASANDADAGSPFTTSKPPARSTARPPPRSASTNADEEGRLFEDRK